MNKSIKTFLLTLCTLSLVTIAAIEISGISTKAFFNKKDEFKSDSSYDPIAEDKIFQERKQRDSLRKSMEETSIQFDEIKHDFGTIKEGTVAKHTYTFTNTGKAPLLISEVISPCGCTTPSFTKQPVLPGQKGSIDIAFDSKNRPGLANKTLTVIANTSPNKTAITFSTNVEK
jgi:hypothetical protein